LFHVVGSSHRQTESRGKCQMLAEMGGETPTGEDVWGICPGGNVPYPLFSARSTVRLNDVKRRSWANMARDKVVENLSAAENW